MACKMGLPLAGFKLGHCHEITLQSPGARRVVTRPRFYRSVSRFASQSSTAAEGEPSTSSSTTSWPAEHHTDTATTAVNLAGKRVALLRAAQRAFHRVQERDRPLADYMTLPASQYSVLDAERIERLDASTFRCYVSGFHFLNFHVEPVLTLSVVVEERGPTVRLLSTELQGSKTAMEANKKFTATMTNVVRWEEAQGGGKNICSDTEIQVTLEVPGWFILPVAVIEKSGCAVMGRVLATAVPRFLQHLEADYAAWATGDDTRSPVSNGEIV